jgi:hypothetical protein
MLPKDGVIALTQAAATVCTSLVPATIHLSLCQQLSISPPACSHHLLLPVHINNRCCTAGAMRTFNSSNQLSQFKGCGYAVADNAFLGLVDTSSPPRVAAEADYHFAHEAPVYLPALKQVGGVGTLPLCCTLFTLCECLGWCCARHACMRGR